MSHAPAVVILPWLLIGAIHDQAPAPREVHQAVMACGFVTPPPKQLREWLERADLVVRVRIDAHAALDRLRGWDSDSADVISVHEAEVLQLLKAHPRGVGEGASQQVLQWGGRIQRLDTIVNQTWNSFPPMPAGTEWVLFLEWVPDQQAFMPMLHQHGAVQIIDGKIAAPSGSLHSAWRGKPAEAFLQALRH